MELLFMQQTTCNTGKVQEQWSSLGKCRGRPSSWICAIFGHLEIMHVSFCLSVLFLYRLSSSKRLKIVCAWQKRQVRKEWNGECALCCFSLLVVLHLCWELDCFSFSLIALSVLYHHIQARYLLHWLNCCHDFPPLYFLKDKFHCQILMFYCLLFWKIHHF